MVKAVAFNGSPRMNRGKTELLLSAFLQGMRDGNSEVTLFYPSRMNIHPCSCGKFYCWNENPGECCLKDDMQLVYPKLREAEILVLGTPVYIPLPGAMQNVMNRLCPLLDPDLVNRDERTRARMRDDVSIQKIVLVATSGWWELGNFDTLVRVVSELAKDASVEFAGALLRPHASFMIKDGKLSEAGEAVLAAAKRAGYELAEAGAMCPETLLEVSEPLISEEEFWS